MQTIETIINIIGNLLSDWLLIPMLLIAAVWFTIRTRGVQFRMVGEMCRLLIARDPARKSRHSVSPFQDSWCR